MIDFANSYWYFDIRFRNAAEQKQHVYENEARIQLDARCEIVDERAGTADEFFLSKTVGCARRPCGEATIPLWQTEVNL